MSHAAARGAASHETLPVAATQYCTLIEMWIHRTRLVPAGSWLGIPRLEVHGFFKQAIDDVLLLVLDETGQSEYEKLERKRLDKAAHSHRCSGAFLCEVRPESNGPADNETELIWPQIRAIEFSDRTGIMASNETVARASATPCSQG